MSSTKKKVARADLCRGFYQFPGLEIQVGETQTLIPSDTRNCPVGHLFRLANGDIIAGGQPAYSPCPHDHLDCVPASNWKRSSDGGRTWRDVPPWPTYIAYQFPDGEIIHLASGAAGAYLRQGESAGVYETFLFRSRDDGYTHRQEVARLIDMPEIAIGTDDPRTGPYVAAYLDHAIVGLPDGGLLASLHGQFAGDRVMPGHRFTWRTFVVRSTDRGHTWRYLSSVAFDLTGGAFRMEGFDEPELLALPDGDLLCFMRTGGDYQGHYSPLYLSRSADGGKSWSQADPITDRGVWPKSCRLANGVIALVYGRPGDWLTFSLDQGHTWLGHFCLHQGTQPFDCGSYDGLVEVAPDTVLVAYGHTDPNDCMKSEIAGTFVTVRSVG